MTDRIERLALFPLHAVLFPGATLALKVFEARYLDMVAECLRSGAPFGVCLIRRGGEVGAPAEPHGVGTLARITRWDMEQPGVLLVEAQGTERFVIENSWHEHKRVWARVWLREEQDAPLPPELAPLAELLARLRADEPPAPPARYREAGWVGRELGARLPVPAELRQRWLEEDDALGRLMQIAEVLAEAGDPPRSG